MTPVAPSSKTPRPPTPGGGKSVAQLVRDANRWRDNYNPLRGLVVSRVVAILEAAERGDLAELQLVMRKLERRYPVLKGLKTRRLAALEKLDWSVKVVDPLPAGVTADMAARQQKFLRSRYDLLENLTEAIGKLADAEFRGYTILQKHRYAGGVNDGAVRELHWLPPDQFSRAGQFGPFYYNKESRFGVAGDACAITLGEANRIGGEELPREEFVIREVELPLYEIALTAFVNWSMGRKDFSAFVEIFGLPNCIVIMPNNIPVGKEDEYRTAAEKVADGVSGALPAGSDAKFPTADVRGSAPFKEFCDAQDADVVLAGTGGRLAMLTADKGGLGDGPSAQHAAAFDEIALADARKLNQVFQTDFDKVELAAEFPGQPILAYFELCATEPEDVRLLVSNVATLEGAGLQCDAAEISEKIGLTLTRLEPAPDFPADPAPSDLDSRVTDEDPSFDEHDPESGSAAAESVVSLLHRLAAIQDDAVLVKALREFLSHADQVAPGDPASAPSPAITRNRILNGDKKGHPFRGNQYVTIVDENWSGTAREMHKRADRIMRRFTTAHHPVLGEVKFSRDGRDKTLHEKRTPHEFQSVQALPELIAQGSLVSSAPDRAARPNVRAFHRLQHGLKIGAHKYRAEIVIKETVSGEKSAHKFYLHRLHEK